MKDSSFEQKLATLMDLSYKIAYRLTDCSSPEWYTPEETNELWGWVDGLFLQGIHNVIEGKCSLQDSLDFSMEQEEEKVENLIKKYQADIYRLMALSGRISFRYYFGATWEVVL